MPCIRYYSVKQHPWTNFKYFTDLHSGAFYHVLKLLCIGMPSDKLWSKMQRYNTFQISNMTWASECCFWGCIFSCMNLRHVFHLFKGCSRTVPHSAPALPELFKTWPIYFQTNLFQYLMFLFMIIQGMLSPSILPCSGWWNAYLKIQRNIMTSASVSKEFLCNSLTATEFDWAEVLRAENRKIWKWWFSLKGVICQVRAMHLRKKRSNAKLITRRRIKLKHIETYVTNVIIIITRKKKNSLTKHWHIAAMTLIYIYLFIVILISITAQK